MSNSKRIGQLKPTILSYKWEIHNFCTGCKKLGEYFYSPDFFSNIQGKQMQWNLKLYPKGQIEESKGYLSLFLCKLTNELNTRVESVSFSILSDQQVKTNVFKLKNTVFDDSSGWGSNRFVHRNIIMDPRNCLLKDDKLTILCEIIFDPISIPSAPNDVAESSDEESSSDDEKVDSVSKMYEANYKQEFNDFETLLQNKNFSDVTLTVGRRKILVHKAILASRSSVFQAMFDSNTRESKENIKIPDTRYEVMEELLRFVYASKVNDIKNIATELLIAAEKYSVLGLKILCEKTLCDSLTIDNAIEYLNLSIACNATQLKSEVIEFIVSNRKDIVNRSEFKSLHSDIMCQVVQAIVEEESEE